MTMGQRIRAARVEAGMSQRELAGEEITRNMLSAIEHDAAMPSLTTLQYLARRLGKSAGYFLGEDGPSDAVLAFGRGEYRRCRELLQGPEKKWLEPLALLREAEQACLENRIPYALTLLERLENAESPLFTAEHRRTAALLKNRCGICCPIPEDGSLLLKAKSALADGRWQDALRYLDAVDTRDAGWQYLMGESRFRAGDYPAARAHYHRCEELFDVRARLEICCREMEDYKMAYFYAKKA